MIITYFCLFFTPKKRHLLSQAADQQPLAAAKCRKWVMIWKRELTLFLDGFIENHYNNSASAWLLTGARQTGKTFAIRNYAAKNGLDLWRLTSFPIPKPGRFSGNIPPSQSIWLCSSRESDPVENRKYTTPICRPSDKFFACLNMQPESSRHRMRPLAFLL